MASGKVYMQTAVDCHSRHARARLYPSKLPVTAVHLMNADVIPTFEEHDGAIETVLSGNGREFCGRPDRHPYELFLQLEEIAHRTTRVKRPQFNGIVERFQRIAADEHFRVEGRRTRFATIEEMQASLEAWLVAYNTTRPHQSRGMNGCIPIRAFIEGLARPEPKGAPQTKPKKPASLQSETRAA